MTQHAKKTTKKHSQVTVFFVMILGVMMLFSIIILDLGTLAMRRTIQDTMVDTAALALGTAVASQAKMFADRYTEGKLYIEEKLGWYTSIWGWVVIVILVIIAIVVTVVATCGGGPAGFWVGLLAGAGVGALVSASLTAGAYLLKKSIQNQKAAEALGESLASIKNPIVKTRETALMAMFMPMASADTAQIQDIHDLDKDGLTTDSVSRPVAFYSKRIIEVLKADDAGAESTTTEVGELLYMWQDYIKSNKVNPFGKWHCIYASVQGNTDLLYDAKGYKIYNMTPNHMNSNYVHIPKMYIASEVKKDAWYQQKKGKTRLLPYEQIRSMSTLVNPGWGTHTHTWLRLAVFDEPSYVMGWRLYNRLGRRDDPLWEAQRRRWAELANEKWQNNEGGWKTWCGNDDLCARGFGILRSEQNFQSVKSFMKNYAQWSAAMAKVTFKGGRYTDAVDEKQYDRSYTDSPWRVDVSKVSHDWRMVNEAGACEKLDAFDGDSEGLNCL
jgi:hypothetical protein